MVLIVIESLCLIIFIIVLAYDLAGNLLINRGSFRTNVVYILCQITFTRFYLQHHKELYYNSSDKFKLNSHRNM